MKPILAFLLLNFSLIAVANGQGTAVPDGNLFLTSGSFGQILGTTTSTARKVQFVAKFNF